MGGNDLRGPSSSTSDGSPRFRASPSWWSALVSACPATVCATCRTPGDGWNRDAAIGGEPSRPLSDRARRGRGRPWPVLRSRPRAAGYRGRERVGQVHDGARADGAEPSPRPGDRQPDGVRRRRPARPVRDRVPPPARCAHVDGDATSQVQPRPGDAPRRTDRRDAGLSPPPVRPRPPRRGAGGAGGRADRDPERVCRL
jgi:hypothetical protein